MYAETLGLCPWLCRAPQQPDTPFAWPVFLVLDSVRIYMAVGALALVVASLWCMKRSHVQGQVVRFAFAMCMCVGAAGTEIEQIGMWPHYRFVVYFAGITLGLWGYWRHLFREIPARDRSSTEQDRSP